MTSIRNRGVVAAIVAASCIAPPTAAAADTLPSTFKSDAAQSGALPGTDRSDAAQSGADADGRASGFYSPAGFRGGDAAQNDLVAPTAFPPAVFRGGDTPVDHPGASRAPTAAPTTIEVVRPERTIVRDVDEVLPLILSSTALLLVLAGLGLALTRARLAPRTGH